LDRRVNLGGGYGSIVLRDGKTWAWRRIDPVTKKNRQTAIRDENNRTVSNEKQALTIIRMHIAEIENIKRIESKKELLLKIGEANNLIVRHELKLNKIWERYLNSTNRPDSGASTLRGYKLALDKFIKWLEQSKYSIGVIDDITENMASEFMVDTYHTGICEKTYNTYLQALKLIFKVVLHNEQTPFSDIRKKMEQKQSRKAFSGEQIKAIFAKIESPEYYMLNKEQMRLMLLICLSIGCRGGDSANLKWNGVNLNDKTITYIPRKTARRRPKKIIVPMNELLHFELQNLPQENQYVLPDVAERYNRNPDGIYKDVMKLIRAAGIETHIIPDKNTRRKQYINKAGEKIKNRIPVFSLYSLRHSFVTMSLKKGGADISTVQMLVGHGNPEITNRIYNHISIETKRQAISCIELPVNQKSYSSKYIFSDKEQKILNLISEKAPRLLDEIKEIMMT
jgi:integrase